MIRKGWVEKIFLGIVRDFRIFFSPFQIRKQTFGHCFMPLYTALTLPEISFLSGIGKWKALFHRVQYFDSRSYKKCMHNMQDMSFLN